MNLSVEEVLDCDVLIIGRGGAGLMAALEASNRGRQVIVIFKGEGNTRQISAFNVPLGHQDLRDNPEVFVEDIRKEGEYLNDPGLARILAEDSTKVFSNLVEYGVPFEKQKGKFRQRLTSGNTYPRSVYHKDLLGEQIVDCLVQKVKSRDSIMLLNNTMAMNLIQDTAKVVGTLVLNLKEGKFLAVRSKTVILATGGAGNLYPFTTNHADITGDGYVLAYNAGAELTHMEFVQFEPTITIYPDSIKGLLMPTVLLAKGAVLLNSKDERFMLKYDKVKKELASKSILSRSILSEISQGYGTSHCGVFFDATVLSKSTVEEGFPILFNHLLSAGIDLRKQPVEVAPASHYMMGGIKITGECETTVPHLYAAGEVSGGIHGANRISGNSATDIFVFGSMAGKFAAAEAESFKHSTSVRSIIQKSQKIWGERYHKVIEFPGEIKNRLQEIMWNHVNLVRDEEGLTLARKKILNLEKEIQRAGIDDTGKLRDALETENLLMLAKLVVNAATNRKQSVGYHYRSDFP